MRQSQKCAALSYAFVIAIAVALTCDVAAAQLAPNAQPQGGVVVGGTATITKTASATTITQSSVRAVVNWTSFNVGAQQTVDVRMPNASASILITVSGASPTQIAGHVSTNGRVYLVNQSGAIFYKGAQIDGASFAVLTAASSAKNFMNGARRFNQPGKRNARIQNLGAITTTQAGFVVLFGNAVANSGLITAPHGRIVLAAGSEAALVSSPGIVEIRHVASPVVGANGQPVLPVNNTGVLQARRGTITMTAALPDGVLANVLSVGGTLDASAAAGGARGGTIHIGDIGGAVNVVGLVSAESNTSVGGLINITGASVTVEATARINVSGHSGGGTAQIGGKTIGTGFLSPAKTTTIEPQSTINANAVLNGNGGAVTLWSDVRTTFAGKIAARGGATSGNGGTVELGSGGAFSHTGTIDVTAPHGTVGKVIFD